MKIAINTRLLLVGRLDGIGWFTYESVRRMVCAHPEHEFYFLFDRRPDNSFLFADNVKPLVLFPQARHPVLWYMFFEWSVARALRKHRIDLFLSTDGWLPLKTHVPTLTVIHDLNFEHATDYLRPSHQRYMTYFFPKFARRATRVATVSEFSKQDIAKTYGIGVDKIDVVYDGSHSNYRPCDGETRRQTCGRYAGGMPYYIFIGTILKRKNLANTLLAFDQFREIHSEGVKLIVVGSRVWWKDELEAAYNGMRHKDDVVFIGRADAEELSKLLGSSLGLVYASFFEGFGIPILEAFNAEVPVITSNCTSMPEVAGDAALLVDPHRVDAIRDAMVRLADDAMLRDELVAKGRIQRELFSWDRTADLLWKSLMKTYETSCVNAG